MKVRPETPVREIQEVFERRLAAWTMTGRGEIVMITLYDNQFAEHRGNGKNLLEALDDAMKDLP